MSIINVFTNMKHEHVQWHGKHLFNHCFVNEKEHSLFEYTQRENLTSYVQKSCSLLLLRKSPNSFETMLTENGTDLGWIKADTLRISCPAFQCQPQILLIYV